MQIKAAMNYHFTLVRLANTNKSTYNKHWEGCGEKGTLLQCQWECKLLKPLWETVWGFLRKLRSHAAVALVLAGGYSSCQTCSLGTSICRRSGPRKGKKKKKDKILSRGVQLTREAYTLTTRMGTCSLNLKDYNMAYLLKVSSLIL